MRRCCLRPDAADAELLELRRTPPSSEDDEDRRDPTSMKAAMKRAEAFGRAAAPRLPPLPMTSLTRSFERLSVGEAAGGETYECRGCGRRFGLRRTRDVHARVCR